jgi:outer membrane murein-binding lipoprotein Lpp
MKHFWKWLGLAACAMGLVVATGRMRAVTAADDDGATYERAGDLGAKVDRLADKLEQLLGRMERGGPPRGDQPRPPQGGPRHGGPHTGEHGEHGGHDHRPMPGGRPAWRGLPGGSPGVPPEMRERFEDARRAMQERMEKARQRFEQLEQRVKSLEAEVERLKASKPG